MTIWPQKCSDLATLRDSYVTSLAETLCGHKGRRILKPDAVPRHVAGMQNLGGSTIWGGSCRRKPKMLTLIQKTPGTQGLFIFLVIFCNEYL